MPDKTDSPLRSFLPVAPDSHFPIQNLPYGVFRPHQGGAPRVGVAIGEHVLDLSVLEARELLKAALEGAGTDFLFSRASLNIFMVQGRQVWNAVRQRITQLLRHDEPR